MVALDESVTVFRVNDPLADNDLKAIKHTRVRNECIRGLEVNYSYYYVDELFINLIKRCRKFRSICDSMTYLACQ